MPDTELFRSEWEEAYDCYQSGCRPCHEFDWFAVDSKGAIACFITAGSALIPKLVFRDKEMLWKIYNYFYEEPEDYAHIKKISSLMEYDVSHYASKGIYSFDNPGGANKPYELIRSPKSPAHISNLPAEFARWLEPLIFTQLSFADSVKIDATKFFDCL